METMMKHGKLHLIIGPMFAGKTSELMRRMRRYHFSRMKCILIKYVKDDRYSYDKVVSHDGREMDALCTLKLMDVSDKTVGYDVVGIDEAQFFPDLVQFCEEQLEQDKTLVVAGLDATFKRTGFENVLNLVPLAHSVDKLLAVCMSCGNDASFTKRVGSETEIVVIGGLDKYMAVCRECFKLDYPPKSSPFKDIQENNCLRFNESDLMKVRRENLFSDKIVSSPVS